MNDGSYILADASQEVNGESEDISPYVVQGAEWDKMVFDLDGK
jgi:hypothetical protein